MTKKDQKILKNALKEVNQKKKSLSGNSASKKWNVNSTAVRETTAASSISISAKYVNMRPKNKPLYMALICTKAAYFFMKQKCNYPAALNIEPLTCLACLSKS